MPVYLDNNATTALDPSVLEAMQPYLGGIYGNPASLHRYGRLTAGAVEQAREQVADLVGAHPSQVVLTGSGTETNNLVIKGVTAKQVARRIAVGAIEHPSVLEPARALQQHGWQLTEIDVDPNGLFDTASAEQAIKADTKLVSLMLANNETGVVQNLTDIAAICQRQQSILHTDASQAVGKIAVDFNNTGAQLMTVSSHKLYGPAGAAALVIDKTVAIEAQLLGGDHEHGLRAGSQNVAAIVGFGAAAALAKQSLQTRAAHMLQLRQRLEQALQQIAGVVIFAEHAPRLPNTVQFGVRGCHGETLLLELDRRGFALSSGSACHTDVQAPSHVLLAMQVEPDLALTAIRVSLGQHNTAEDIDKFIAALTVIVHRYQQSSVSVANI